MNWKLFLCHFLKYYASISFLDKCIKMTSIWILTEETAIIVNKWKITFETIQY